MTGQKEWNEFLDNMVASAADRYRQSTEYEYIKKQYEEIDMILCDNLTVEQKELVEKCMFDMGLAANRESDILYKQGMQDCIFILKQMGVLA